MNSRLCFWGPHIWGRGGGGGKFDAFLNCLCVLCDFLGVVARSIGRSVVRSLGRSVVRSLDHSVCSIIN